MKKRILLGALFAASYAVAFSVGIECLLNLLGACFAISLDGRSVVQQYPRFIPFCVIVGFIALAAIVLTFVVNVKASERLGFTKSTWCAQMISAPVLSIPMIKAWEMLFDFLQKAF